MLEQETCGVFSEYVLDEMKPFVDQRVIWYCERDGEPVKNMVVAFVKAMMGTGFGTWEPG